MENERLTVRNSVEENVISGVILQIKYRLIIGDDGVGMNKENSEDLPTLGSELIETFTAQLNGTINRLEEPGTMFSIVFDKIDKEL